jgi:hypothetical protein
VQLLVCQYQSIISRPFYEHLWNVLLLNVPTNKNLIVVYLNTLLIQCEIDYGNIFKSKGTLKKYKWCIFFMLGNVFFFYKNICGLSYQGVQVWWNNPVSMYCYQFLSYVIYIYTYMNYSPVKKPNFRKRLAIMKKKIPYQQF